MGCFIFWMKTSTIFNGNYKSTGYIFWCFLSQAVARLVASFSTWQRLGYGNTRVIETIWTFSSCRKWTITLAIRTISIINYIQATISTIILAFFDVWWIITYSISNPFKMNKGMVQRLETRIEFIDAKISFERWRSQIRLIILFTNLHPTYLPLEKMPFWKWWQL